MRPLVAVHQRLRDYRVEASWDEVRGSRYDGRWPGAEAVVIGFAQA